MEITSAKYTDNQHESIKVVLDGQAMHVPDNMDNRHRQVIAEWEAEGNTIEPYVAPEKGYEELRRGEYPPMGDQFDAIWKYIAQHREDGEVLGEDIDKELDKVLAVKAKYPKEEEE